MTQWPRARRNKKQYQANRFNGTHIPNVFSSFPNAFYFLHSNASFFNISLSLPDQNFPFPARSFPPIEYFNLKHQLDSSTLFNVSSKWATEWIKWPQLIARLKIGWFLLYYCRWALFVCWSVKYRIQSWNTILHVINKICWRCRWISHAF